MTDTPAKPIVKLTGEDGNAFMIIGLAVRAARRAGWTEGQVEAYKAEAMSGNYDHLLQTTMKHFTVT